MGKYVNPGADKFEEALRSKIYIDKSELISYTNSVFGTLQKYVCVSRPRRFGKSMAADMISAYYDRSSDTKADFIKLRISQSEEFTEHINKYDVIKINAQEFLSRTSDVNKLIKRINDLILRDILSLYPDVDYYDKSDMIECLGDIYDNTRQKFVVIIDEWDCIFREYPHDTKSQEKYLDFMRDWLKDKAYIGLVYMTGILPIKKYGTHSALNMFSEFSMENPGPLAEYTGFTKAEVSKLCETYDMSSDECDLWYDGYRFPKCDHIYNPNSIVKSMMMGTFDDYWNQTESYEALKNYIYMNYDGLKDSIIKMMAGGRQKVNTGSFQNDMTTFANADDVLTLLIHLGYLSYDFNEKEVFIPNMEILQEFVTTTTAENPWKEVIDSVKTSNELLNATWNMDENKVAGYIENAHLETSHIQYNDENALSYTISLAYYAARDYYTVYRELPTGKGFADMVFVPRKNHTDKPAMIIELKWDKDADTAISQIKEKNYPKSLLGYRDNLLLVGINYDRKTRKHECKIERY